MKTSEQRRREERAETVKSLEETAIRVQDKLFLKASREIRAGEYQKARMTLREASRLDMENPEAYNLLGISYELEGDMLKAAKFYRVSYYMDQTFQAPSKNLHRVSRFWYQSKSELYWGLESVEGVR